MRGEEVSTLSPPWDFAPPSFKGTLVPLRTSNISAVGLTHSIWKLWIIQYYLRDEKQRGRTGLFSNYIIHLLHLNSNLIAVKWIICFLTPIRMRFILLI